MKRLLAQLVIGVMVTTSATGQGEGASVEFKRRANQWMTSADPAKRQAAYRSWMQLGTGGMTDYRQALEEAAKYHSKRLDELSRGRSTANPYAAHHELARQLDEERARVMPLIKTDWKKDGAKIAMLREEMGKLEKLSTRVNRLAAADTKRFDRELDAAIGGMMEVAREQARFDKESEMVDMDDDDLRGNVLKNHVEGCVLLPQRERFDATRAAAAELAKVEKENADAGRWAKPAMKSFATILNRERYLVGMIPLRLDEKLHDATQGHSEDMARLGFFAHESPVEGKKTPWDRARLAGFAGNGRGENIFMGSASPDSAYNAWFASDGHRFTMFGGGNVLGVGISGVHWTMMTGSKS